MQTTKNFTTIAKCGNGHIVKGDWDDAGKGRGWLACPCGSRGIAKGLTIRLTDTQCGARCTSALGPTCDCSCGGAAHGEDHRL